MILKVGRAQTTLGAASFESIASTQSIMATSASTLTTADNPVESVFVLATADPALDPLQTSADVVPVGEPISITVTIRNVGRDPATNLTVTLYDGVPGKATMVDAQSVPGSLAFNETQTLVFTLAALGGEQPIYAEITTSGGNASTANDQAASVLGLPSTPSIASVEASTWTSGALDVALRAVEGEQPAGYRSLRAETELGSYELAGESAIPVFTDTLAQPEQTYCYRAQAHNNGTLSPLSEPVCGQLELADFDTDSDGLDDATELDLGTDRNDSDSDDDDLLDGEEVSGISPWSPTNPLNPDSDGDGLSDGEEVANYSDPNDANDPSGCTLDHDFNSDDIVDLDDVLIIVGHSIFVSAAYDPTYDVSPFTGDGVVDIADIFEVALHFGESCPAQ